jgi:excisionase family DNA binding protein
MNEYLSTRQVIEILKVDRITIYRMLQDGRLKGVKIGQQWRFPQDEVERLLAGEPVQEKDEGLNPGASLPTHCFQTIQDLYSGISGMSGLMVDREGKPLTEMTSPCKFCQLILNSQMGRSACETSWQNCAQAAGTGLQTITCHAGLNYIAVPIVDGASLVGYFITGQYIEDSSNQTEGERRLKYLSEHYGIPEEQLHAAAQEIPVIPAESLAQLKDWSLIASRAVQSILYERTGYLSRLQQIAQLSQIN